MRKNLTSWEPIVTIVSSETDKLKKGLELPISQADQLFKQINGLYSGRPEKELPNCVFSLKYLQSGKTQTYRGMQRLGRNNDGLVENIRTQGHGEEIFVNILKRHVTLARLEQLATKALDDKALPERDREAFESMLEFAREGRDFISLTEYAEERIKEQLAIQKAARDSNASCPLPEILKPDSEIKLQGQRKSAR